MSLHLIHHPSLSSVLWKVLIQNVFDFVYDYVVSFGFQTMNWVKVFI